jgi:hypothetical protein
MPRTLSRASQVYPAGTYGPFSIDSFTRDDADGVRLTATVEGWPASGTVARIDFRYPGGSGGMADVPAVPRDRQGNALSTYTFTFYIPRSGAGNAAPQKKNFTSAQVTIEILQPIRTALTLEAF